MYLRNKLIQAINKGLNEALDLDDFSEDDLKILKKSLGTVIKKSNLDNNKPYYQDLMNKIMSNGDITKEDILNCIDWYKEYGVYYNPYLDGKDFKSFIYNIIDIYGKDINIYNEQDKLKWGININLNWIDTSYVTSMNRLFRCSNFNGDISEWDVSHVTNMEGMFYSCSYTGIFGDISSWDVSNVKDMSGMFWNSMFCGDISNWDVSNVKDMSVMFKNAYNFNIDISSWDVSNVNCYTNIFDRCIIDTEHTPKFNGKLWYVEE